jgi:hypothetical protein
MRSLVLALIVVSLASAGCGDSTDGTPTAPSGGGAFTETFAGTLKTGGTAFYSFAIGATNLGQPANLFITLTSVTTTATGAVVTGVSPQIGIGVPAGTGCALNQSVLAPPGLAPQISVFLAPGTYCVSITDTGGLTGDSDFAVRITQGALNVQSSTSPETFASNLAVKGTSTRTFTIAGGTSIGTVTATLSSVTPSQTVGFAIGVWRSDNNTCSLTASAETTGGASFSLPASQGIYCIKVFDTGTLTDFVAFSVAIAHP